METKNSKSVQSYSKGNLNGAPKGEIETSLSFEEAEELKANYRKKHGKKVSVCHVVPVDVLQKFWGIPNFQGINIYNGLTHEGQEILIVMGLTKIDGDLYNVHSYKFNINDDNQVQSDPIHVEVYKTNPCPPPVPPATKCPSSQQLIKAIR